MAAKGSQPRRRRRTISLSVETWERVRFLRELFGRFDEEHLIELAVHYLDRTAALCRLEGSELYLVHRDGTKERVMQ